MAETPCAPTTMQLSAVIFAAVIASLSLMAFQKRRSCSRTSWVFDVVVMEASSRDSVIPLPAHAGNVVRAVRRDKHSRTLLAPKTAVEDLAFGELRRIDDAVELVEILPRVGRDIEAK